MSDLNWCTYCDNAIAIGSNDLYCSQDCLKLDTLPLLNYQEDFFKNTFDCVYNRNTKYIF
ncbi:hypothetical protein EDC94DRAFT_68733 [Helicostylum pulchrum]|nr:hypothetical protein EDC94DRAFT_68733 [Helicostylum pulchrum]